jgi:hypothetical protein
MNPERNAFANDRAKDKGHYCADTAPAISTWQAD